MAARDEQQRKHDRDAHRSLHAAARLTRGDEHLIEDRDRRAENGGEGKNAKGRDCEYPARPEDDGNEIAGNKRQTDRRRDREKRNALGKCEDVPAKRLDIVLNSSEDRRRRPRHECSDSVYRKARDGPAECIRPKCYISKPLTDNGHVGASKDVPCDAAGGDVPAKPNGVLNVGQWTGPRETMMPKPQRQSRGREPTHDQAADETPVSPTEDGKDQSKDRLRERLGCLDGCQGTKAQFS